MLGSAVFKTFQNICPSLYIEKTKSLKSLNLRKEFYTITYQNPHKYMGFFAYLVT